MTIDVEEVRKAALLARIRVSEDELPAISEELSSIIELVEQLKDVDIEGVEPMTSVSPMHLHRRQDKVETGGAREKVLGNAPETREGFFVVPKVVE